MTRSLWPKFAVAIATLLSLSVLLAWHVTVPATVSQEPTEVATPQVRPASPTYRQPSYVNRYEITTRDDLRYAFLLRPLIAGDNPSEWRLIKIVRASMGQLVADAIDAPAITDAITGSMPAEGQKPLARIDQIVAECARTLAVEKPKVFVQNSSTCQAYIVGVQEPRILVLTSGLLALFEDHERELRFVIGHELGHAKCDHLRMRAVSLAILESLRAISHRFFESDLLTSFALSNLLAWCREAEVSADRAGLLCCQDIGAANNALGMLLSGVPGEVDVKRMQDEIQSWRQRPFVDFVAYLKGLSLEHPFVSQRMARLGQWHESGHAERILARRNAPRGRRYAEFKVLCLTDLCEEDATIDPYLKAFDSSGRLAFVTTRQREKRAAAWAEIEPRIQVQDGEPLFFEVWDSNLLGDQRTGHFILEFDFDKCVFRTSIFADDESRVEPQSSEAKFKVAYHKVR